jgi:hypothetical protein
MVCRECGEIVSVSADSGESVRFGCACDAMIEARVDARHQSHTVRFGPRNEDAARLRRELDQATQLRELFVKYIENVLLCEGVDFIDAYPYSDGVDLLSEEKKVLRELAEEAHNRVYG